MSKKRIAFYMVSVNSCVFYKTEIHIGGTIPQQLELTKPLNQINNLNLMHRFGRTSRNKI